MNKFISYEGLPLNSGGAHAINSKSPVDNYNNTLQFLEKYAFDTKPKSITLTLYESKNNDYSTLKLIPQLSLKNGIPKIWNDGFLKSWRWNLNLENINNGFEALEINKKLPRNYFGPIVLSVQWNFDLIDPKTGKILPNQDKFPQLDNRINKIWNSRLNLRLSKKSTISAWLAFPFEQVGEYEENYIRKIKTNLPFKPSDKHWRIWNKSKNGNWTPRKIK